MPRLFVITTLLTIATLVLTGLTHSPHPLQLCNQMIIDRFEANYAICECDGHLMNIPRHLLPATICEGDVINQHFRLLPQVRYARILRLTRLWALVEDGE